MYNKIFYLSNGQKCLKTGKIRLRGLHKKEGGDCGFSMP